MEIVTQRTFIRRAINHARESLGWHKSGEEHGRDVAGLAALDPETATSEQVEATKASSYFLDPVCSECDRGAPLVVEFDAPGYEEQTARVCPECLAKAVEAANAAAVPA